MKKLYILLASAGILAFASCARTELEAPVNGDPAETTTLTLSFDATRTQLVNGKTAWAAGDKVRIFNSDGKFSVDVAVPESAAGATSFQTDVNISDTKYYAVYPVQAGVGVEDSKVKINIPGKSSGRFADANICAAESEGTTLSLRNVASIVKINVNSGNVVEMLQINSKNAMVGNYTVAFGESGPELAAVANDTTKSVNVAVGGVDGDYFVSVAPGEFDPGLSITALRGNGGYQTLTSYVKNTVAINTIVDLGVIGNQLSNGLSGEGTESSPYLITNLGEFGAFAASVDLGNSYEDKYLSLQCDVTETPVSKPIGFYITDDEQAAFAGHFIGNNHKIAVDLDGANSKDSKGQHYVALFGELAAGASISDLVVEGTVKADGGNAAGVVGSSEGSSSNRIALSNIKSSVKVDAKGNQIAGIAGYACYTDIVDCENNGTVSGNNSVAGICGYMYYVNVTNCVNNADVTSIATAATGVWNVANKAHTSSDYANGTGGVAGWAQNSNIKNCNNTAAVTGYTKIGGVVGVCYWSNVDTASNTGAVSGKGYYESSISSQMGMGYGSAAGGVIGIIYPSGSVKDCTNSAKITGKTGIGGVVGFALTNDSANGPTFNNLKNTGDVIGDYEGVSYSFPRGVGGLNAGAGGVFGSVINYAARMPVIADCENRGKVYSPAVNAGGIIGLMCDSGNSAAPTYKVLERCENFGDISCGQFRVGGIVGYHFARYTGRVTIRNCSNHGTISGNRPSGNGTVAGGILGGVGSNGSAATYQPKNHVQIYNCYNDGDVVYAESSLAVPYVGGIVGFIWDQGTFQNNCNVGYVGPADKTKTPVSGAEGYLGGLAGVQQYNTVHYSYSSNAVLGGQLVGTSGKPNRTDTVCSFDPADGTLAVNVTSNNKICDKVLDALNEWQNYYVGDGNVYYNWTGAAGHPVFDTTMN